MTILTASDITLKNLALKKYKNAEGLLKHTSDELTKLDYEFIGFIAPWKGAGKTPIKFKCKKHPDAPQRPNYTLNKNHRGYCACLECFHEVRSKHSKEIAQHHVPTTKIAPDKRTSKIKRLAKIKGATFIRWTHEDSRLAKSKAWCRCDSHNVEYEVSYHTLDIRKNGCRICANVNRSTVFDYDSVKPCTLYIQFLSNKYIKYGITRRDPHVRMNEQSCRSVFDHKLIHAWLFEDPMQAVFIEDAISDYFMTYACHEFEMPDGYTETLYIEDYRELLSVVDKAKRDYYCEKLD